MRRIGLLTLVCWAGVTAVLSFCAVRAGAFEPGRSSPQRADLDLTPMSEDEYAESLTFVAYFPDGSRAEAGFQLSNLGPGSNNASFNAEVVRDGKVARMRDSVKHRYRWTSAPLTIEMGEMGELGQTGKNARAVSLRTLAGQVGQPGHVVELVASCREFNLRLRFRALTAAWRPGSGQVRFGDRIFQYLVQVPRAEVTGEVNAFGKQISLTGTGYVEHGRTNADPRKHTDRQLRLRYFDTVAGQPLTLLAYDHLTAPADGARRFGFVVLFVGDRVVYENLTPALQGSGFHPDPARQQNLLPTAFQANPAPEVQLRAQITRLIERSDYLDELSGLTRLIVRHFVHPISYNYDCAAEVKVHLPALDQERKGWADCGISLTRP